MNVHTGHAKPKQGVGRCLDLRDEMHGTGRTGQTGMLSDEWTMVIGMVVANVAFIGMFVYVVIRTPKRPQRSVQSGRYREYGHGIVHSDMDRG